MPQREQALDMSAAIEQNNKVEEVAQQKDQTNEAII